VIVVADTSVLIALAGICRLNLLEQVFGEILIPQAVYDEVLAGGPSVTADEVSNAPWIQIVAVEDILAVQVLLDEMDLGEAEVIVTARELNATLVLMDDRKGRRKLDILGLPKIGTLGLLLHCRQQRMIPALAAEIDALVRIGFNLDQRTIDKILAQANESDPT
jgi:predicted nucleic acid-binding protein